VCYLPEVEKWMCNQYKCPASTSNM